MGRGSGAGVLQIRQQDLGGEAVVGEDEGLLATGDEFGGDAAGLVEVAAADAELAVDDRRVVENKVLLAGGGTVFVNQMELFAGQGFGQRAGIGDGGRAADELGIGAVEGADAFEAADEVGEVGAVDTAVVMEFVDRKSVV